MGEGAVHLQQVRGEGQTRWVGEGAVHLQQVRGKGEGGWMRVQYTFSR